MTLLITAMDVESASLALVKAGEEPTWSDDGTTSRDLADAVNWQAHRDGRTTSAVLAEALFNVRVYPPKDHGGTWGVSHHQCWVEGSYASAAAAAKAPFVDVEALHDLWVNTQPGSITAAQLGSLT